MSPSTEVLLPTQVQRKQIFQALKQWSSYTAWRRIQTFYEAWAGILEAGVREASSRGWDQRTALPASDLVLILRELALLAEAVDRLRRGDRRVFRFNGPRAIESASNIWVHWCRVHAYIQSGDMEGGNEFTVCFDEFMAAVVQVNEVWSECGPRILEPHDQGTPILEANIRVNPWLEQTLIDMTFPDDLPEVPDPVDSSCIKTGRTIPCSGIWEPVIVLETDRPPSLFRPSHPTRFAIAGCMNYLHGGARAPYASRRTPDASDVPTLWRLLWRDDRYLDGTVPAEEASYRFLAPRPTAPAASGTAPSSLVMRQSGETVPVGGRWVRQDRLDVVVQLEAGQKLPLSDGIAVSWVLAAD